MKKVLMAVGIIMATVACASIEQRLCPAGEKLCLDEERGPNGSFFRCVPAGEECHTAPPTIPSPSPSPTSIPEPSPEPSPSPVLPSPSPTPSPSATPAPSPSPCGLPDREPDHCWTPYSRLEWEVAHHNWERVRTRLYVWKKPNGTRTYVACDGQSWRAKCWRSDENGVQVGDGSLVPIFGQWPETGQGICPVAPCPSPSPSSSPSAPPSPPASPTPTPSGAPPLTESGNFPVPSAGFCPAWFANASSEVRIAVLSQRKCDGKDAPADCTITNLHATEMSVKPFCEHSCYDEQGRYALSNCRLRCELWRPCQQPEFVDGNTGIGLFIAHPDWNNEWGFCDKRSAGCDLPDCRRNFICHDNAINRSGPTRAMACAPGANPDAVPLPQCGPVIEYRSLP